MAYGKDMLDKIRSNNPKNSKEMMLEQTKGALTGSAIGLFLGLYIGHSRNYNLIVSGLVGAVVAGLVTKILIEKK